MPFFAGDPPGVLVCLDDDDFGMSFENSERGGMDVESAEVPAQGFMLLSRQILIAEKDDEIVEQRIVEFLKPFVAQRKREIYALQLGADEGGQLAH